MLVDAVHLGFDWLSFVDPSREELLELQHRFGLHEVAVDDILLRHDRPKFETYPDDVYFVVLRTAYYGADARARFGELAVFLGRDFVVTSRKGGAHAQGSARAALEARPDLLVHGVGAVLWAILAKVVGDIRPVVDQLDDDLIDRDRLTSVLEANLALIAHRQNQSLRKISGWAAILAVPTLIAGVFGMNFQTVPGSGWHGGFILCLALMALAAVILFVSLRRARWM